jgi:hypothetical protein
MTKLEEASSISSANVFLETLIADSRGIADPIIDGPSDSILSCCSLFNDRAYCIVVFTAACLVVKPPDSMSVVLSLLAREILRICTRWIIPYTVPAMSMKPKIEATLTIMIPVALTDDMFREIDGSCVDLVEVSRV